MIEGIVSVVGLCITFFPPLMYLNYLLTHVNQKTRFDYHIEIVNEKKGKYAVILAYLERIMFGVLICVLGILMSEFFRNDAIFKILVFVFVFYIIVKYFDEKNEK
ncbi:MAG TPA: hypothetical protein DCE23_09615 [Firmicutes bacterium]|nr:hypothetical protein [Bacillota bacterium]